MSFTKFATFEQAEVLEVKGSPVQRKTASLDKLSDFEDYRTGDGYMYVRIRAISSRTNKNHDGWPSVELAGSEDLLDKHKHSADGFTFEAADGNKEFGYATFLGKPFFVDHNNSDPKRTRGAVIDSKFRLLGSREAKLDQYYSSGEADPEHLPPVEVELLIECDAKKFPKLAKAIKDGDIDGFSMGCDVERSKCSHCGHVATNPDEYCSHIVMKGAHHDYKTADGKKISRKSYENCYGIKFFEISAVFDPADDTALTKEIKAAVQHEGAFGEEGHNEWPNEHGEWPWDVKHEPQIDEYGNESVHLPPHYPNVLEYLERLSPTPEVEKSIQEHRDYLDHIGYPRPSGDPSDPRMGRTAEAPLPQSFQPSAPEEVDTLRKQQVCPVCGEDMEGDTCEVCGYEAPPEGFDNPDLTKAKEIQTEMKDADSVTVPDEEAPPGEVPGAPNEGPSPSGSTGPMPSPAGKNPGSFMQQHARNSGNAANVTYDMSWEPIVHSRVAGRINKNERPIRTTNKPATNEPTKEKVIGDQEKPVTSSVTPTMLTAQSLIQRAQRNHTGETMSSRTADGPTAPDAAADKRTDVEGVGGVLDASNEQASQADAQVDVNGVGSTGVTDIESESTQDLPTAGRDSDDAGFNKDKTTEDSGKTTTYGDSDGSQKAFTDPVTNQAFPSESSWRQAGDAEPWPNDEIEGGSANKGTQPVDPIGKAQDRVDVLKSVTSPENNSGATKTWSGTDGNGVTKQQDPITKELQQNNTDDAWTSHYIAALKVADTEVDLGLIEKDEKYNRLAELIAQSDEVIATKEATLSSVKTAGLKRLAEARTASVKKLPSQFGRRTAAPGVGHYDPRSGEFAQSFQRVAAGAENTEPEIQDESSLDAGLFI